MWNSTRDENSPQRETFFGYTRFTSERNSEKFTPGQNKKIPFDVKIFFKKYGILN